MTPARRLPSSYPSEQSARRLSATSPNLRLEVIPPEISALSESWTHVLVRGIAHAPVTAELDWSVRWLSGPSPPREVLPREGLSPRFRATKNHLLTPVSECSKKA